MAVYTHISHEDIAQHLQQYDVGELHMAVGIAEGVENSNYLLECEKAGVITKYILTLYEKRVDANDLPFFMGLMEHLAQAGIQSPVPIHAKDEQVILTLQGRPAALISFLKGSSRTIIRNPHVESLGKVIGRMHVAVEQFDMQRANSLSIEGWRELAKQLEGKLDGIHAGLEGMVREELAALEKDWPHDLPRGIIHADLFPDNVFFEGDEVSGVIDFYFACEDLLAYELAICLNCWCFDASGEFNLTRGQKLLHHYHKVRPLSDAEKRALPILARGAALRFLLTRAYDWVHQEEGAMVTPKDPMEYVNKLVFHQGVKSPIEYGLV